MKTEITHRSCRSKNGENLESIWKKLSWIGIRRRIRKRTTLSRNRKSKRLFNVFFLTQNVFRGQIELWLEFNLKKWLGFIFLKNHIRVVFVCACSLGDFFLCRERGHCSRLEFSKKSESVHCARLEFLKKNRKSIHSLQVYIYALLRPYAGWSSCDRREGAFVRKKVVLLISITNVLTNSLAHVQFN